MSLRSPGRPPSWATRGNCYAAAEALYHVLRLSPLLNLKGAELQVRTFPWQGDQHWYLILVPWARAPQHCWTVIDPSWRQFRKVDRPTRAQYLAGRRTGFLTREPSRRARKLMEVITWQP